MLARMYCELRRDLVMTIESGFSRRGRRIGLSLLLFGAVLASCTSQPDARTDPNTAAAPDPANATVAGIYEEPITLTEGVYEGEPFVEDRPARPRVNLIPQLTLAGDLDGDGAAETAAFVEEHSGGTGRFLYVFVLDRVDGEVVNVGTHRVGDRVDVRGARIEDETIVLEVVQSGPDDAACCPTQLATRSWTLSGGDLEEQPVTIEGTLSLATLEGTTWRLQRFGLDGAPIEGVDATVTFAGDGVAGFGGCNQFSGKIAAGENAGDIEIGPVSSTKKLCPGRAMEVEDRFLPALSGAKHFGFVAGSLVVSYENGGELKRMFFEPFERSDVD